MPKSNIPVRNPQSPNVPGVDVAYQVRCLPHFRCSHMSVYASYLVFIYFSFSFQLHDNALALHEYTRDQKKRAARGEGNGFDGDLDNFQEPELSSLVRLVRFVILACLTLADGVVHRIWMTPFNYEVPCLVHTPSDFLLAYILFCLFLPAHR